MYENWTFLVVYDSIALVQLGRIYRERYALDVVETCTSKSTRIWYGSSAAVFRAEATKTAPPYPLHLQSTTLSLGQLSRSQALWRPSMNPRNLISQRAIDQPMSSQRSLALKLGTYNSRGKRLSTAT